MRRPRTRLAGAVGKSGQIRMTLQLQITTEISGVGDDDPLFDPYEIQWLLDDTRQRLEQDLTRQLGTLVCAEHQQAPQLHLKIVYDALSEQLDVQYHIETCCPLFRVQVVKTLNQT
jgi:hypothetical protein